MTDLPIATANLDNVRKIAILKEGVAKYARALGGVVFTKKKHYRALLELKTALKMDDWNGVHSSLKKFKFGLGDDGAAALISQIEQTKLLEPSI